MIIAFWPPPGERHPVAVFGQLQRFCRDCFGVRRFVGRRYSGFVVGRLGGTTSIVSVVGAPCSSSRTGRIAELLVERSSEKMKGASTKKTAAFLTTGFKQRAVEPFFVRCTERAIESLHQSPTEWGDLALKGCRAVGAGRRAVGQSATARPGGVVAVTTTEQGQRQRITIVVQFKSRSGVGTPLRAVGVVPASTEVLLDVASCPLLPLQYRTGAGGYRAGYGRWVRADTIRCSAAHTIAYRRGTRSR